MIVEAIKKNLQNSIDNKAGCLNELLCRYQFDYRSIKGIQYQLQFSSLYSYKFHLSRFY